MTELPILFSAPMVRALLDGRKTQTRRLVKPSRGQNWLKPELLQRAPGAEICRTEPGAFGAQFEHPGGGPLTWVRCPYGPPGAVLWVRETFRLDVAYDNDKPSAVPPRAATWFEADLSARGIGVSGKTRVSIHMPRWASRISLRVADVRVERLNEISEADALAEGVQRYPDGFHYQPNGGWPGEPVGLESSRLVGASARAAYEALWAEINGPASWAVNPWVWAVAFERTA